MSRSLKNEIIMNGKVSIENLGSMANMFGEMTKEEMNNTGINLRIEMVDKNNNKYNIRIYKPKNTDYVQIDINGAKEFLEDIKETQREFTKYY